MNQKTKRSLVLALCSLAVLGATAGSYGRSGGAPASMTGAPGELDCTDCHASYGLNSGTGTLSITGVPATYAPGSTYGISVSIAEAGMQRWGFEVTAILASGAAGGTLTVTDAVNTQLITANVGGNLREYVTHTTTGTYTGTMDGPVSWGFDWTAPLAGSGTVTFYVAGVAANNANGPNFDYVYTTTATSNEGISNTPPAITLSQPIGGESWTGGAVKRIWWNMSDGQDANGALLVWINYSTDGGTTYANPIAGAQGIAGTANPNFFDWSVPMVDSVLARVNVTAVDTGGVAASGTSPADFEIDSTAPTASGSPTGPGVSVSTWINVTFSEGMDRPSAEGAFTLLRTSDWTVVPTVLQGWTVDTMTFSPVAPLADATTYQGNVSTAARDDSDPGNLMATALAFTFTTVDMTPPSITGVTAMPDPQQAGGFVNISAVITDATVVAEAFVDIVDPNAVPSGPFVMTYDSIGGRYYHNATYAVLGTYQFTITARDAVPNENTAPGTFSIGDTTPPEIYHTPIAGGIVGAPVDVDAQVLDGGGVGEVRLNYTDVLGTTYNVTMAPIGGDVYRYTIPGQPSTGSVCYFVWAVDVATNTNLTATYCFNIVASDPTPPTINSVAATPDPQEAGLRVNVTADISDNVAVYGAWVEVYDPTMTLVGNFTMGYDILTGTYYYSSAYGALGTYTFAVWTNDTSDNWATAGGTFVIQDTLPPGITSPTAIPDPQALLAPVNVSAAVVDNVAVAGAWVEVYDPTMTLVGNFTMGYDPGSSRYFHVGSYSVLGQFTATVWASDTQGNWASTLVTFQIVDATPPSLGVVAATPDPQNTGLQVNITADITDDVAVYGAWVEVYDPLSVLLGNFTMSYDVLTGTYYHDAAYASPGLHTFAVWTNDTSDNWATAGGTFTMVDVAPPTVDNVVATPPTQPAPGTTNVTASVSDNTGLDGVWVEIRRNGQLEGNFSMSLDGASGLYYHEDLYPIAGSYTADVWARDLDGNWATGRGTFTLTVGTGNTAPELSWVGDAGYATDGVEPESGNSSVTFRFRVLYQDADNDMPAAGQPVAHILQAGVELSGGPFVMSFKTWAGGAGDFVAGVVYEYATVLPLGTGYSYFFTATDKRGSDAAPTTTKSGPLVVALNTAPTITVTSPHAGERYVQREKQLITWTMSDGESPPSQLTVYLNYTSSGGSGEIAGPLAGYTDYVWIIPDGLVADDLVIHATVVDPEGATTSAESSVVKVLPPSIPERSFFAKYWAVLLFLTVMMTIFLLWVLSERRRRDDEDAEEEPDAERVVRMRELRHAPGESDGPPPGPPDQGR